MLEAIIDFLPDLRVLLIVCPIVFFAGIVDGLAGGGGLITVPMYIFAGLPIHQAYATNKFVNGLGTIVSTASYIRAKKVDYRVAITASVGAILGGFIGTKLVLMISERYLQIILLVALPIIAVFILLKRDLGKDNSENSVEDNPLEQDMAVEAKEQIASKSKLKFSGKKLLIIASLIGLIIGCYDGFFGPGTGTFLIIALTLILGLDLVMANGTSKFVNLASNTASMFTFLFSGKILFSVAIPASLFAIAGNYLGARLAITKGAKYIRPMMIIVLGLLFITMIYEFFK